MILGVAGRAWGCAVLLGVSRRALSSEASRVWSGPCGAVAKLWSGRLGGTQNQLRGGLPSVDHAGVEHVVERKHVTPSPDRPAVVPLHLDRRRARHRRRRRRRRRRELLVRAARAHGADGAARVAGGAPALREERRGGQRRGRRAG